MPKTITKRRRVVRPARRKTTALVRARAGSPARRPSPRAGASPIESNGHALADDPMMTVSFIGTLKLTSDQIAALRRPVVDEEVEWKPARKNGEPIIPYLSHNGYRDRLDAAFGLGGWGMVPVGMPKEKDGIVYVPYALAVEGIPRVYAWGEQEYHATKADGSESRHMTYGDALEGAKSNAILRCGKELGIARELWHRPTIEALKRRVPVAQRMPGYTPAPRGDRQPPARDLVAGSHALSTAKITKGTKEHPGQLERLWAIIRTSNRSENEIRGWLRLRFGLEHTADIQRRDYDYICKCIKHPGALPLEDAQQAPDPGAEG